MFPLRAMGVPVHPGLGCQNTHSAPSRSRHQTLHSAHHGLVNSWGLQAQSLTPPPLSSQTPDTADPQSGKSPRLPNKHIRPTLTMPNCQAWCHVISSKHPRSFLTHTHRLPHHLKPAKHPRLFPIPRLPNTLKHHHPALTSSGRILGMQRRNAEKQKRGGQKEIHKDRRDNICCYVIITK